MCTAISFLTKDHYFGRNLDLEYSYEETITITPRHFSLPFRKKLPLKKHFAMIGTAYIQEDFPLYYDAVNEAGLAMAGLNFPEYAKYQPFMTKKDNITPFELIPWVLGQCTNVAEAHILLSNTNLLSESFNEELPLTPLHWLISDKTCSIVAEPLKGGLKIYENPVGVLTNSPTFDIQLFQLKHSMSLPGDWSSQSRFIKASFVKTHSVCNSSESDSISQFFHILNSVEYQRGCTPEENGSFDITVYSNCYNTDKGIYYYRTYHNSQISAIDMSKENLDNNSLISYPMIKNQQIHYQNK